MKKRLLLGFLLLASSCGILKAQSLEFGTLRTPDSPGFFMVEVYPDPKMNPLRVQDVFIKHFGPAQTPAYEEIIPVLKELGAKIIELDQLEKAAQDPRNRILVLGSPVKEGYPYFFIREGQDAFDQFEVFANEHMDTVYLKDPTFSFGANISEVYPQNIRFIGSNGITLVGKFEQPVKTALGSSGFSASGPITAKGVLPLHNEALSTGSVAENLGIVWEQLYFQAHRPKPKPSSGSILNNNQALKKKFEDLAYSETFPWILGGFGLLIILIGLRSMFRGRRHLQSSLDEAMMEDIKPYLDENKIPFSVEKKGAAPEAKPLNPFEEKTPPQPERKTQPLKPQQDPSVPVPQPINTTPQAKNPFEA